MNHITIWQPRWKDRVVLIAAFKVKERNLINFSKTPSLPDKYFLSGPQIRSCAQDSNGKTTCYAVPIDYLKPYEGDEYDF